MILRTEEWMVKHILLISFFLLPIIILASCVSISYSKTGNYIDYSYPVRGALLEKGTITYTKQKPWFREKQGSKEGISITCLSDSSTSFGKTSGPLLHKAAIFIINMRHDVYNWKGTIEYSGVMVNADVSIDVYGDKETRIFVLHKARIEQTTSSIKMREAWDMYNDFEFPYWIGNFSIGMNEYRIFFVLDDEYTVSSSKTALSDDEKEYYLAQHSDTMRNLYFFDYLFREDQKFQIISNAGTVVAEICGDTYLLYDALPEHERGSIKQNIGIFSIFLYKTKELYNRKFM
jgi:hypothetical protein